MAFEPTHRVGNAAIPTWPTADRSQSPGPELTAGLEVRVIDRQGDLARIQCSNDWEAWVDNASLELITSPAVSAPPAPGPPAAAAKPKIENWRKLVPFMVGGIVIGIAGMYFLNRGEDKKPLEFSGLTEFAARRVLPSSAAVSSAAGGTWVEAEGERCSAEDQDPLSGGDDCSDDDSFDFLCADENVSEYIPISRAENRFRVRDTTTSLYVGVRVYGSPGQAIDALDVVSAAYTGPCTRTDEDNTTVMSPLDIDAAGDEHVAGQQVDETGNAENRVWMRFGRVLVSFELRAENLDSFAATMWRNLGESIAAKIPSDD